MVSAAELGQRLDILCATHLIDYSRAVLQRAIKGGDITVNGQTVKPRYLVRQGDIIAIPLLREKEKRKPSMAMPPPSIIYQDKNIVVINKPAGTLVHPTQTSNGPTIASWFADRYPNGPGHVHRLDKDTTGVLALAKNQATYEHLKKQFKKRHVKKEYLALVFGVPKAKEGRITKPITRSKRNPMRRTVIPRKFSTRRGSTATFRGAITEWRLEKAFNGKYALLHIFPFTGRTHQIRVHLHHIGYPIVGDTLYIFKRQKAPRGVTHQLLHAEKLTLTLLSGSKKTFTAPLPDDFASVVNSLQPG